mmetsp:Transcript_41117/g.116301  ORF Transcript_41117/g.116301 Transcript_41117/m.116301 type:complete len:163 (-) Transcript_41117:61-549(-)
MGEPRRQHRPVKRSTSEYVRSPQQQAAIGVLCAPSEDKKRRNSEAAKAYFQKQEAQVFADSWRPQIEQALDEEPEEWDLIEFSGDFVRKGLLKVRAFRSESDGYLHIFALRLSRADPWAIRVAPRKSKEDPLLEDDEDMESVPEIGKCGQVVTEACSSCSLM